MVNKYLLSHPDSVSVREFRRKQYSISCVHLYSTIEIWFFYTKHPLEIRLLKIIMMKFRQGN
jgi:hypothetical protein